MVEAILWAPIVIAVGIGSLATKGAKVPTCKGVVIEADGKRPLAGALVMVKVPRAGKVFVVTTQTDGSFVLNMKSWWTGPPEVHITAFAQAHGRAVTITGRDGCRDLILELPTLSEKEWRAFRDGYVHPVLTSTAGPMWDVDPQGREELESFATALH